MTTTFLITLEDPKQCDDLFKSGFMKGHAEPRIAMVGRSNVGKSTLINLILEKRDARVSQTPGRTRAIHFFKWHQGARILADLPGYGFAKGAKKDRIAWAHLIRTYFESDSGLERVMILWDSRIGPTDQDLEATEFFLSQNIPITLVITKSDQLKTQSDRARRKREILAHAATFGVDETDVYFISEKDKPSIHYLKKGILR